MNVRSNQLSILHLHTFGYYGRFVKSGKPSNYFLDNFYFFRFFTVQKKSKNQSRFRDSLFKSFRAESKISSNLGQNSKRVHMYSYRHVLIHHYTCRFGDMYEFSVKPFQLLLTSLISYYIKLREKNFVPKDFCKITIIKTTFAKLNAKLR